MSEFDEKLTVLHKKFHFMEPGLISDILNQVGCDLQQACIIISAMIPDEEKDEKATEEFELQKVLELSRQENDLLRNKCEAEEDKTVMGTRNDMSKSPDPPPIQIPEPVIKPTLNFAQKAAALPSPAARDSNRIRVNSLSNSRFDVKDGFNLYIMRGLPGSGKSTLAKKIYQAYIDNRKRAVICSADDFFYDKRAKYVWDGSRLSEAHELCKQKSERHLNMGFEAVIIDNTNIEIWNMITYANMALRFRYRISIEEPNTSWKLNVRELAKRNKHGCSPQTISGMKQKWEMCTTAELVKIARLQQQGNSIKPAILNAFANPPIQVINAIQPSLQFISTTRQRMISPVMALRPHQVTPSSTQSRDSIPNVHKPKTQSSTTQKRCPQANLNNAVGNQGKIKCQYQVQANAKNVPESLRQSMIPADPVDPNVVKYKEEMKKNHMKRTNKVIKEDETYLPADLLDDEENETTDLVEYNPKAIETESLHTLVESDLDTESEIDLPEGLDPSDEEGKDTEDMVLLNPIGHGRLIKNDRQTNSELTSENDSDFDFLNHMSNDWGSITKKLTQDQIPKQNLWTSDIRLSTSENATQTSDNNMEGRLKIVHGNYQSVDISMHENRTWEEVTNDKSTQSVDRSQDHHARIICELSMLFPDSSIEKLEKIVFQSGNCLGRAIEILSDAIHEENLSKNRDDNFELQPEVLSIWNESIDMDDIDRGFREFEQKNVHQPLPNKPLTIRDPSFFEQLTEHFGQPIPNYVPSPSNFTLIPLSLAEEIYNWWKVSLNPDISTHESSFIEDEKLAKELQNEEVAFQIQERFNNKQCEEAEIDQEFPTLHGSSGLPNSPRIGQWMNKQSLGYTEKVNKLQFLFPSLPLDRVEEFLRDNSGDVGKTAKLICDLTNTNINKIEYQRKMISTTATAKPEIGTVVEARDSDVEYSIQASRDNAFSLQEQANENREKSRNHYRNNDGLVAQHYASEAERQHQQARKHHNNAAEMIYRRNNSKHSGKNIIDLHGLRVHEGLNKLKEVMARTSGELLVITGRGRNSELKHGKLRTAVESYLVSNKVEFSRHAENQGVVKIVLNKG